MPADSVCVLRDNLLAVANGHICQFGGVLESPGDGSDLASGHAGSAATIVGALPVSTADTIC
jgi:hypothetical protein